MAKTPSKTPIHPITSPAVKKIAGKGEHAPSTLTTKETRTLAASVLRHIEPRKGGKP